MILRRRFLQGLGSAVLALPFLESVRFTDRRAQAAGNERIVYSVFMKQGNGCQQRSGNEPERFWPRKLGQLTKESLSAIDGDRAVSELAAYADKLLLVRGTRHAQRGNGCAHSGGINQCLTAGKVTGEGRESLSDHESIDWRIAQECNPVGVDPLTLMSGPQRAYHGAGLSYSGPRQLRGAQSNPFDVYTGMVGLAEGNEEVRAAIAARRTSVNDLVRDDMQELLGKADLSADDRQRLELHFAAIRDLELGITDTLADSEVQAMKDIQGAAADNANRVAVARMHMNIIALAFATDLNRTATMQMGSGNDGTRYYIDGQLQSSYHRISHRIDGDGIEGTPIAGADLLHHKIDRLHARLFRHLLDRLAMYAGPSGGPLLDDTVALWTNDLATGPGPLTSQSAAGPGRRCRWLLANRAVH